MPVSDRQEKGDVIYRQDAIEVINKLMEIHFDRKVVLGKVWQQIKDLPSAQKKGHWVENHDSDHAWKCSECGCGYTDSKLSFCYDCGADMRGDDDE